MQNTKSGVSGEEQCNKYGVSSKCECCCFTSECNAGLCPYANEREPGSFTENFHVIGTWTNQLIHRSAHLPLVHR